MKSLNIGKELEAGSHTMDSSWAKGAQNAKKRKEKGLTSPLGQRSLALGGLGPHDRHVRR